MELNYKSTIILTNLFNNKTKVKRYNTFIVEMHADVLRPAVSCRACLLVLFKKVIKIKRPDVHTLKA